MQSCTMCSIRKVRFSLGFGVESSSLLHVSISNQQVLVTFRDRHQIMPTKMFSYFHLPPTKVIVRPGHIDEAGLACDHLQVFSFESDARRSHVIWVQWKAILTTGFDGAGKDVSSLATVGTSYLRFCVGEIY